MLFPNAFPPRRIVFCANNFEVVVMMIDFNAVFVVVIILMMVSRVLIIL